ncbi:MAG: diphthine--ammonia ligase [Armatimonadota bacterium]|nr:diphthine--ammonia ligase [Armatimonadota bacterium]
MNRSSCGLFWSGGKDSALALHHLLAEGVPVRWVVNLFEGSSGRVRFHGVRADLVRVQAASLGIELLQRPVGPEGFEEAFLRVLGELLERGCGVAAFGNVHLRDVREWYEVRVRAAGFEHVDPLWGRAPEGLVREFVALGYRAVVTSVYLSSGRTEWLGAQVDSRFLQAVQEAGADPCGESGEYHTFVFDGPAFSRPVGFRLGEQLERDGHRFLDLLPEVPT